MGNHSKIRTHEETAQTDGRSHRRVGGGLLRFGSRVDAARAADLEADEAVAGFQKWKKEVNAADEKISTLKQTFKDGLEMLIHRGVVHRDMEKCLPDVGMIRILDEIDGQTMGGNHGYLQSGYSSTNKHYTQGRFLAVETLDDRPTAIHEMTHIAVRLGDPNKHHVLDEALTNRIARNVLTVQGMDATKLDEYYEPHERLLDQLMTMTGLNLKDMTYFASGDDPFQNDFMLQTEVYNRVGWNMLGFMQNAYVEGIKLAEAQQSEYVTYDAAHHTQQALNEQLAAMGQLQYA